MLCLMAPSPPLQEKSARTECCLLPDGSLSTPLENVQTAERFAKRGYVVVSQVIGRGEGSGGIRTLRPIGGIRGQPAYWRDAGF